MLTSDQRARLRNVVDVLRRHGLGDIAEALGLLSSAESPADLEDRAPPVEFSRIRAILQSDLGRDIEEVFERLDDEPILSTSTAQVYRGRLRSGRPHLQDVRVKVLRPTVSQEVSSDLTVLREVPGLMIGPARDRGRLERLLADVEEFLRAELDLREEARNIQRLSEAVREWKRIRVPRVVGELSGRRVLVVEDVGGRGLSETAPSSGGRESAEELWRAWLKQVFAGGAFHCPRRWEDIRVDEAGALVLPEPGALARCSHRTALQLTVLLPALLEGDESRAARACAEAGVSGDRVQQRLFARDVGDLLARSSGARLGDKVLALGKVCLQHGIDVPREVRLAGRTLAGLESVCRQIDPGMDPGAPVKEMAATVLGERITSELDGHRLLATGLDLSSLATEIPFGIRRLLDRASSNDLQLGIRLETAAPIATALQRAANRVALGLVSAGLILGSALIVAAGNGFWGLIGLAGFAAGAGLGLWLAVRIWLSERPPQG